MRHCYYIIVVTFLVVKKNMYVLYATPIAHSLTGWANKCKKGGIYCKKGGKCGVVTTFFCIFTFEDEEVVWRGDLLTINTGY